jgi:multidrug resistance protein MdtO
MRGWKPPSPEDGAGGTPSRLPLLGEMERTVSLIHLAFTNSESLSVFTLEPAKGTRPAKRLLTGALLDPEHVRFALRGCLAATSCYLIFNALFWPEISTSVTTCFLTALTTIGASRQKQALRFAGAVIGGVVFGFGAQVFILPSIDSIAGFTALFVVVIGASAWITTSSPRLSYLGVQIATAFCLINLQEFAFQTSLTVARDRVVGVLLGLAMMWLFFDQLWSKPAGVELRRNFAAGMRLLAQLVRGPAAADVREAIEQSYELREAVHARFDKVRALADGVLFEFGESRRRDMDLREQIREWQPQLRTLFVMRIASLKYRLRVPGFELPESVRARLEAYDEVSARIMDEIADRIDRQAPDAAGKTAELDELLEEKLHDAEAAASEELTVAQFHSFVTLLEAIDKLTRSVAAKIPT